MAQVEESVQSVIAGAPSFEQECRVLLRHQRERHVSLMGQTVRRGPSRALRLSGTIEDVTERTHAEDRIKSLAYFDALTGLPNRLLFTERVRGRCHSPDAATPSWRCCWWIDNFKGINDTLGHGAGDMVLKEVGARLRSIVRDTDLLTNDADADGFLPVSRLGGDEFLMAVTDLGAGEEAASVARRILSTLRAPMMIDQNELFLGASIGISAFPDDGSDFEAVFRNADVALYHAKDSGRNTSEFFSTAMNESAMYRMC